MLQIKKGSEFYPFGLAGGVYNESTKTTEDVLQYLKERFPEDIEESGEAVVVVLDTNKETEVADNKIPVIVAGFTDVTETTKQDRIILLTAKKDKQEATAEELKELAVLRSTK